MIDAGTIVYCWDVATSTILSTVDTAVVGNNVGQPESSHQTLEGKWCQVTSLQYHSSHVIIGTTGGRVLTLSNKGDVIFNLQPHHTVPCYVAAILPLLETNKYLTVGQGYRDSICQLLSGTRKDNSSSSLHLLSWILGTNTAS